MAVYYITFGSHDGLEGYSLESSPAAHQKSAYLIEKLDEILRQYNVITLSETKVKNAMVYPSKTVDCLKHGKYTVWKTFGKPFRFLRKVHFYLRKYQLMSFLSSLHSSDTVIAYHSLITARILTEAKEKTNFALILELEEIYQDVVNCSPKAASEEKNVISVADGYILATEALSNILPKGKPYIVVNGTYHAEEKRNVSFADNKIHCVYAGTFDPTKGGAAAAAAAAEFLPENYHVHILGFGTAEQTKNLKKQISEVQARSKCTLTYDGLKSGEEYIQFLQKCHIGLCTQIPDAKYTETSFPSKILVYLANGLRVLSVRIPAVEQSAVGSMLYYYDKQTPEEIASAILSVNTQDAYDSREVLCKLDHEFQRNLKRLLDV